MLFVLDIRESPFFLLLDLSFSSWRGGRREEEEGGGLPLWDAKVLPVHCAAGCQVKLGSTGSVSVKKSILDGRLLPGKSVLIPGLILDQKAPAKWHAISWKMNTFCSGNWMEMCQVIAPVCCFDSFSERCGCREWGLHFQNSSTVASENSRGLCWPAAAKCLPHVMKKWDDLEIKTSLYSTVRGEREVRCIIDGWIMCLSWPMTFSCWKLKQEASDAQDSDLST